MSSLRVKQALYQLSYSFNPERINLKFHLKESRWQAKCVAEFYVISEFQMRQSKWELCKC